MWFWKRKKIETITVNTNLYDQISHWRIRAQRAERLLNENLTPKEIGRGHHIADLEQKNKELKRQIRIMQEKAEYFNNTLYATGLIVNCWGCIAGGPNNYKDLTEEKVKSVEEIAFRLRKWWNCNEKRISS